MTKQKYFVPIMDNGGGTAKLDFVWSFLKSIGPRGVHSVRVSDSHPSRGRNRAAKLFLDTDCEYLLFIDSDIIFEEKDLLRLEESDEPLIGGTYFLKQREIVPCANALPGTAIKMTGEKIEVKRTGTGFMRIHRSVFEALKTVVPEYRNMSPSPQWDFFGSGVIDGEWLSEDWYFCDMARKVGIRTILDTGILLRHEGAIHYPVLPDALPKLKVCPETMKAHIEEIFAGEYTVKDMPAPATILDLGGNIGGFAIWASENWPEATITSFEPSAANCMMFEMNTKGKANITLHRAAVGPNAGSGRLYYGPSNAGEHSLVYHFGNGWEDVSIEAIENLPRAEFVKIDVEGMELEVCRKYDFSGTKTVCLEYHQEDFREQILGIMERAGFTNQGGHVHGMGVGVLKFTR